MKRNMRKSLVVLFVLAFSFSGSVFAQIGTTAAKKTDLNTPIPLDRKVITGTLDNGLTYYIRENKLPEGRAEFHLALKAGSILETDAEVGLAPFTEHMAFNGTKYYPGNQMIDLLEKKGITFGREINAYTGFDQTVYQLTLTQTTPEYLKLGFEVLDGWASGLLMDGKEIDSERGVIIEEWRGRLGVGERFRVATWPITLKGSKYADRLPIGTLKNLQEFKHETIRGFYNEWYRPDLMAIILVGDFNGKEMEKQVKEIFGAIPKRENPKEREYFGIPNNVEPLIAIASDKEATSTSLSFFWKHDNKPTKTIGDYRTQHIVNNLFTGMLNARLGELAEKADCPFRRARVGRMNLYSPLVNVFLVDAAPKDNLSAIKSFQTALTELARVRQHGFLEVELERQKDEVLSAYERYANEESKTQSSRFASEYVNLFLDEEPAPGARAELRYVQDLMEGITLEEINALAKEWMTKENFVFELTGPEKADEKLPTEKDILNLYNNFFTLNTEQWVDNYVEEPLVAEELTPAAITKRFSKNLNDSLTYTEVTLANGVKVVMLPTNYKNDQIIMSSYSPGGNSLYGDDKVSAFTYAANIIDQSGLGNFTSSQLEKKLKGKQVGSTPGISELSESINGSSTPKDVETMFELTYMYFKSPRKDEETFDRITKNLKTQVRLMDANPQVAFMKKLLEVAYPGYTRAIKSSLPTIEDVEKMTLDEIYDIYTDRFKDASDFTFFFIGNFEVDELLPLVQKYLGNLPSINREEKWIDRSVPFAKGKGAYIVEKGVDKQGILYMMSEQSYEWNEQENIKVTALGRTLGITVREIIREKMGGTYSPSVQLSIEKLPNPKFGFIAAIQCDPDKAKKIEKETLKIVKNYTKKGTDAETLAKVKEQMIAEYKKNYSQENGFWLGALMNHYNEGRNLPRTIAEFEAAVNNITIDDIRATAAKYLQMTDYVSVTLKPEKAKK